MILKKIIYHKFWLRDKIKTNKNCTKGWRKKMRNQKNEDECGKNNTCQIKIEWWNWKKNKTFLNKKNQKPK